jgi:hypothetical protein
VIDIHNKLLAYCNGGAVAEEEDLKKKSGESSLNLRMVGSIGGNQRARE